MYVSIHILVSYFASSVPFWKIFRKEVKKKKAYIHGYSWHYSTSIKTLRLWQSIDKAFSETEVESKYSCTIGPEGPSFFVFCYIHLFIFASSYSVAIISTFLVLIYLKFAAC